ncbi:MAG TPA: GMP/IMP nucleotidase [Gammaproteobacteria bacterium]|nr:GMP/IMP nucleotidase [Gammaproteobacteria bacterium]
MIDWRHIHWVFLDMDGTLLDLHFDNQFWREHVPLRYAQRCGMTLEQAKDELYPRMRAVEGTMSWYCVDYWSRELDLDIAELKRELQHLIAIHPYVVEFLDTLRRTGRRVVMITNAHRKSLALKMERTELEGHFDRLICSHDLGRPKEQAGFWDLIRDTEPFEPHRTLLVDDSLAVLRAARDYGITHLLAVHKPDTRGPHREVTEFPALDDFLQVMPPEAAAQPTSSSPSA